MLMVGNEVQGQNMGVRDSTGQSDAFSQAHVAPGSDSRLPVEIISHPLSRIRVVKTTMDAELSDLCDFLRRS